jgi:hypothetical protein
MMSLGRYAGIALVMVMVGVGVACSPVAGQPSYEATRPPTGAVTATPAPPSAAATTSPAPTSRQSTVTIGQLRQRPLRFPTLAATDPCPADSQGPVKPNPHKAREYAFGSGPAYLNGNNLWYAGGQGANLMFNTGIAGWMLVRTHRLDGEGQLHFSTSTMPAYAREPWRLAGTETPDGLEIQIPPLADHWPVWSGILTSNSAGCFGVQVDGDGYAGMIVIWVAAGPAPPG